MNYFVLRERELVKKRNKVRAHNDAKGKRTRVRYSVRSRWSIEQCNRYLQYVDTKRARRNPEVDDE